MKFKKTIKPLKFLKDEYEDEYRSTLHKIGLICPITIDYKQYELRYTMAIEDLEMYLFEADRAGVEVNPYNRERWLFEYTYGEVCMSLGRVIGKFSGVHHDGMDYQMLFKEGRDTIERLKKLL